MQSQGSDPGTSPGDGSLLKTQTVSTACPVDPKGENNTNFTLRSLLETLIHKDNHCQPPFIYCKSQVPQESIQGFFKRKIKKHMRMLAGPGPAEPLSSRLRRALPRAPCIRICNLLARTVPGLLSPAPSTCTLGAAAAVSVPAGMWGRVPSVSGFMFLFLLKLLFNSAKGSILFASFFKLEFFLIYTSFIFLVYFASYELFK